MVSSLSLACAVGLIAGLSIGCIGVGGIIIVPALVQVGGVPVHAAIAAAMAGFIVTGLVGPAVFMRQGTLGLRSALPPLLGAMPGAVAGALAARAAPATLLLVAIAGLTSASGLQILLPGRGRPVMTTPTPALSSTRGSLVGLVTGFLSALTGTGGPAVLLPILLWLEVPVLAALGLAQAIQLPIALLATADNAHAGTVDWALSLPLGLGLAIGTGVGAQLAHALDQGRLRRLVGIVLLAFGLLMYGRVAWQLV